MKNVFVILGVIILISMFGLMFSGINEAQTDSRDDSFLVVTGVAETTADVVLVGELYDDSVLNVETITSDLGTDVPLATDYTALTQTLEVSGLTANDSRTLTVTYKIDALTGDAAMAGSFFGFVPLLAIIAVIVLLVSVMVGVFRR